HHVMEFRLVLNSLGRASFQFVYKQRMRIRPFAVSSFWHLVIWKTILERSFAKLRKITETWQHDIGSNAVQLSGTAGHAIKLLDRQFKRTIILRTTPEQRCEPADFEDRLDGTFAESVL